MSYQYGPELVTNGTFNSDVSGWTSVRGAVLTWSSGRMVVSFGGTSIFSAMQSISMTAGKIYEIKIDVVASAGANRTVSLNTSNTAANSGIVAITAQAPQIRTETFYYLAEATQDYLLHIRGGNVSGDSITVDNISVREVLAGGTALDFRGGFLN